MIKLFLNIKEKIIEDKIAKINEKNNIRKKIKENILEILSNEWNKDYINLKDNVIFYIYTNNKQLAIMCGEVPIQNRNAAYITFIVNSSPELDIDLILSGNASYNDLIRIKKINEKRGKLRGIISKGKWYIELFTDNRFEDRYDNWEIKSDIKSELVCFITNTDKPRHIAEYIKHLVNDRVEKDIDYLLKNFKGVK